MFLRAILALLVVFAAVGSARAQESEVCELVGSARRCVIPLAEDTLLYVENRGVTRILANLNGFPFKLATDPAEVGQGDNTFPIPLDGVLTIDMAAYMLPGFDANVIEFTTQGPAGSDWEFIIAPVFVQGQTQAAYRLNGLEPFPQTFALLQSYPNPFTDAATITYTIPESRITGLPVSLVIYDLLGRRVRTLVEARQFPGTFRVMWDGRDGRGQPVPGGLYLGRIEAGDLRRTVRLTRLN